MPLDDKQPKRIEKFFNALRIDDIQLQRLNKFFKALGAESDRGAALAAAAYTEDILNEILASFLADVPATKDLTEGFAAPIGTLASKSKLAYALGLLDKELFDGIDICRRIRNEFAHTWTPVSFDADSVKKLVKSLARHPFLRPYPDTATTRIRFDAHIAALLMQLAFLPDIVRAYKRVPTRLFQLTAHNSLDEAKAARSEVERSSIPPRKV